MCASIAPTLFSVDSGVVSFKKDPKTWDKTDWKAAKEAAAACPNGVIEIIE
jgi:ferredoxin